jgi:hypothetical protein
MYDRLDRNTFAAALMGKVTQPGAVADMLYRAAGNADYPQNAPAPSLEVAMQVAARGSAHNVTKLIESITDPQALDTIARRDKRKTVRRLISRQPVTTADTMLHLLTWAINEDPETAENVVARSAGFAMEAITVIGKAIDARTAMITGTNYASKAGLHAGALVTLVTRAGDPQVLRAALALNWPRLRKDLLTQVIKTGAGSTELLRTALADVQQSEARALVRALIEPARELTEPMVDVLFDQWDEYADFPWDLFISKNGGPAMIGRTATEQATAALQSKFGQWEGRAERIVAGLEGVGVKVRSTLLRTGQRHLAYLISRQKDLDETTMTELVDGTSSWPLRAEPSRDQWPNPLAKSDPVPHPIIQLITADANGRIREIPATLAARVSDWALSSGGYVNHEHLWRAVAVHLTGEQRLGLLRHASDLTFTRKWLDGELEPKPTSAEVRTLIKEPGTAFRHVGEKPNGLNTVAPVYVPDNPQDILAAIQRKGSRVLSQLKNRPWLCPLLDAQPQPLKTLGEPVVGYLWDRLGTHQGNVAAVEGLLDLGLTWEGTLEDLIEAILGLYLSEPAATVAA